MDAVRDRLHRPMRDLRISVTDRCNFRCTYCMPREIFGPDYPFLRRSELLKYEEIRRLAGIFVRLGVRKIRVTGGEPLLRRELPTLISGLSRLEGLEDLTLTTNGVLLGSMAKELHQAGLHRVTVSLDSLDPGVFRQMSGVDAGVETVLAGIDAAILAGLSPIKVNAVVQRGVNEHTLLDLVEHFRGKGIIVRFIEYMDVGNSNGWQLSQVVTAREILEIISTRYRLRPVEPNYRGEVARRLVLEDGSAEIGIISSVSAPFCGDCSRARLSSDGSLYTCLFASTGLDLRGPVREGRSDEELAQLILQRWKVRDDRYSEERANATTDLRKVEMSHIGG